MGIRKRRGKWHYQLEHKGRLYSGSTGLADTERNRASALKVEKQKRREVEDGAVIPDVMPFDRAAGEFITWAKNVEYRDHPNTAERLRVSLASAVECFQGSPVHTLNAGRIEDYKSMRFTEHQVKPVTVRHDLHALSVFFQWAKKYGWCADNPIRDVTIPSDADAIREHVITPAEEATYFEAAAGNQNLFDLARLMLLQGFRPEEVMSSRKVNFNAKAATYLVTNGKTRAARRLVHLDEESVRILEARMSSPGPWLFPSSRKPGKHIAKLRNAHEAVCAEVGLQFVLYDLRHTYATRMLTEGKVDIGTLAAMMGHANLRTIQRYVHPQDDAKKEAVQNYRASMNRKKLKVVG